MTSTKRLADILYRKLNQLLHMSSSFPNGSFSYQWYVIEKEPEKSFSRFIGLLSEGVPGLVISREYPAKIKGRYELHEIPIFWLSHSGVENAVDPDELWSLKCNVEGFTKQNRKTVVLLDGLDYLVIQIGVERTIAWLDMLKEVISRANSQLIISLDEDAFFPTEFKLFRKVFNM